MDNQDNIQDELRSLSSELPGPNSQNPFSVPEGYFDGLAASVLARVRGPVSPAADELLELSPLLAGISKTLPYTVPQGYFTDNMASLSSLINEKESAVLKAIGKQLPYAVPQGYFDELPLHVLKKVAPSKPRVVPMFARTWMRAAVAAIVGGLVFLGGYSYLNSGKQEGTAYRQPADTTQNWVAKNDSKVVQDIQKSSTEELNDFIQTVPVASAKQKKPAVPPTEKKEVKELLKDVSDREVEAFLEQLPASDEEAGVIDQP